MPSWSGFAREKGVRHLSPIPRVLATRLWRPRGASGFSAVEFFRDDLLGRWYGGLGEKERDHLRRLGKDVKPLADKGHDAHQGLALGGRRRKEGLVGEAKPGLRARGLGVLIGAAPKNA
jgi:hypothetical protein